MKNHINIILTISFSEEKEGVWLAVCDELGTSTYGDTFEEVKKEILELIKLHLNTLEKVGDREKFFKENKIKTYTKDVPKEINIKSPVKPNVFVGSFSQELQLA